MHTVSSQLTRQSLKKNYFKQNYDFRGIPFFYVCVKSPYNYVHLLINMFMRKQNQTDDQEHSIPGSCFVIHGKKLHTGILEQFTAILLSPMNFAFKKNTCVHIHFVQSLAVTGYSPKHPQHTV